MKKLITSIRPLFLIIAAALFMIGSASTAAAVERLDKRIVDKAEVAAGTYTVVLVGSDSVRDPENIALLAKETGDGTPMIEVFSPILHALPTMAPDIKVLRGLTESEALAEGERFIGRNVNKNVTQISEIASAGNTLAYEVKPLYQPQLFGTPDVINTYYTMRENGEVLHARIALDQTANNALNGSS